MLTAQYLKALSRSIMAKRCVTKFESLQAFETYSSMSMTPLREQSSVEQRQRMRGKRQAIRMMC